MGYNGSRSPTDTDPGQWRIAADYLKEHWAPEPGETPVFMTFCPYEVDRKYIAPNLPHYRTPRRQTMEVESFVYLTARQLELLLDLDIDLRRPDKAQLSGTVAQHVLCNYP